MANRLAQETSPYLLQHKDNPVDWRPWGPEALEQAAAEDKPIMLSVGYSACHWCHVMERESFEDDETAALINESFVPIKVDREERPDVDDLYMEAVQGMTGQGGWPLTVFLDSDAVPYYGGTYFPPEPRQGLPSFRQVLEATSGAYRNQREELREASAKIRESLNMTGQVAQSEQPIDDALMARAISSLQTNFDRVNGGFGGPPKFPSASTLELLLDRGETQPVQLTLDKMMHGGIYDQLGGGFARYTVDASWIVPHFEKMLYDNALLARVYLHGWQVMGEERWMRVCTETLDWALREMRGPEGGFYSALDADSEGEEGLFYVWNEDEMRQALSEAGIAGDAIERVLGYWGVSDAGNFEGKNILHVPLGASAKQPDELADARTALYAWRDRRVRPGLDDKRILSWNALMIAALADAGAALGRQEYIDAGAACARFVLESMRDQEGRLLRTWKDGEGRLNAYLEDHAYLLEALLRLYEATLEVRWFDAARETADAMIARFADDGARRLLHHLQRSRGADRPPQGRRRSPDPLRELLGHLRTAAAGRPDRGERLRGPRDRDDAGVRPGRDAAPRCLQPPAPGDRFLHFARSRGRPDRPCERLRRRGCARRARGSGPVGAPSARRPRRGPRGKRAP